MTTAEAMYAFLQAPVLVSQAGDYAEMTDENDETCSTVTIRRANGGHVMTLPLEDFAKMRME